MKFSNCKITMLFFVACAFGMVHLQVNTTQNPQDVVVENLLQQAYTLPPKIDHIVERLALLVSKHQISNIKNKAAVIDILRDIRLLLSNTLKDQATINTISDSQIQAQIALALLHLCDSITAYLDHAIKQNFTAIKPFDISQLTKRHIAIDLTPEQISENLTVVANNIKKLDKKAEFAGLTWYNIATRKFENTIVKPCNKYKIPQIATIGALTSLTSLYLIWRYGHLYQEHCPTWIQEKIVKRLVDTVGKPVETDGFDNVNIEELRKDPEYRWLSIADLATTRILSNKHPQLTAIAGLTVAAYLKIWKKRLKPWLTKKGSFAWNFLRGGAYEKKAIEGVWDFVPTVRFKDVIGLDEIKESLSFIIRFIDNPEQYLRVNTAPEKGFLLTGPTRTGKSFMVEALCGEIYDLLKKRGRENEFKFWKIDSSTIHQYGITDILEIAKDNAPIVLFIDEIDLLGLQRVANNELLSQFLTSMGTTLDSDPSKQVILIGATNKPETTDIAIRQYGRLGKEIRFEYPAFKFRKIYLEQELNNMALDLNQFDLTALAQKTEGKSFEDLRAIVRNAMIRSWTRGQKLTQQLLEESLDTEIRRIIMTDRKELSKAEKYILATHFAGRALAMTLLKMNAVLDKVTIKAVMTDLHEEGQWENLMNKDEKDKQKKIIHGAIFTRYLHDTINLNSYEQIVNEIKSLLAGFMAEEILLGSCSYKCHPKNSERAYAMIESLVFEGVPSVKFSKKTHRLLADKVYELFKQYKQEVKELLAEHRDDLEAIAQALEERDILTGTQIQAIIDEKNDVDQTNKQESAEEKSTNKLFELQENESPTHAPYASPEVKRQLEKQLGDKNFESYEQVNKLMVDANVNHSEEKKPANEIDVNLNYREKTGEPEEHAQRVSRLMDELKPTNYLNLQKQKIKLTDD